MTKFLRALIAPTIAAFLAVGAAHGAFYQWSKTAASNATVDASINWSEGMSPSSVNDSARAMMARAAEYRDDISGLLATSGTSTAYTVTTNQGLPSPPNDGQMIAVTMHATNGVAPTLAADGGTAYPIQTAAGTAVATSVLVSGTPYSLKFSSSASAWILRNFYGNPFSVPLGTVLPFAGTSAPNSNFVLAYGQCISRTTYATFFAQVGTTFGACDGTTTFGVPDLRGRAPFGVDNMGGTAANRITAGGNNFDGTVFGATGGAQNHTLTIAEMPSHNHTLTDPGHSHGVSITTGAVATGGDFRPTTGNGTGSFATFNSNTATTGITMANTGGGGSHTVLNPAIILTYIIRVI